jgi:hypothetical protein
MIKYSSYYNLYLGVILNLLDYYYLNGLLLRTSKRIRRDMNDHSIMQAMRRHLVSLINGRRLFFEDLPLILVLSCVESEQSKIS